MYLERHKNISLSATFMHWNMYENILSKMTKPSARDFFFLLLMFFCKLEFITSTHLLSSPIAKLQKETKKTKKKHQPAHHTSLRNTMCLQAETSVIMCNHFYARLKKLLGSVKYNSLMTPYPYKAVCTFLKYCITKSNST